MNINNNSYVQVSENLVLPHIAPYLDRLRQERFQVFKHSMNVALLVTEIILRNYTGELSLTIEDDSLNEVIQGALLHDIGKLQVDNNILLKSEDLTDAEFEELRKHPVYGYDMVKDDNRISPLSKSIIRSHHEVGNGQGYPDRLKHSQISNAVKLVNICDRYDAMTETRPYRPKKDPYTAFKILKEEVMQMQNEQDLDLLLLLASVKDK